MIVLSYVVTLRPAPVDPDHISPTPGFMTGVRAWCRKHGTLFVMDEVATGFGRTGKLLVLSNE